MMLMLMRAVFFGVRNFFWGAQFFLGCAVFFGVCSSQSVSCGAQRCRALMTKKRKKTTKKTTADAATVHTVDVMYFDTAVRYYKISRTKNAAHFDPKCLLQGLPALVILPNIATSK